MSYDAIAAIHGTRASVVAQRVMRGNAIVADLEGTADPATVRVFPCQGAAKTAAIDVFKAALKVGGSTYDDVCQALEERYNVTLCLLVGNNEKQVYRLLYDALKRPTWRDPKLSRSLLPCHTRARHRGRAPDARRSGRLGRALRAGRLYLPGRGFVQRHSRLQQPGGGPLCAVVPAESNERGRMSAYVRTAWRIIPPAPNTVRKRLLLLPT